MSTTDDILLRMEQCLARIEALLATPPKMRGRRWVKKTPDYSAMIAEQREAALPEWPIARVIELWNLLLPNNPKPILSVERRQQIRGFIARFHSLEDPFDGVRGVFEHVAANPYWTGRTAHKRRLGLSEVISHVEDILEGTYK